MSDTRMDAASGGESKITRAVGQTLAGVRSAASGGAAGAGEVDASGFSAVLATLGLPGDGDMPVLALPALDEQKLPGSEPMAVAGLADLVPMAGQAPWMSLIGQTAQLDGKGDADLRRGVAGDFLSGRGNAGLLAQRQALAAGAHAAFMAPAQGLAEGGAGPVPAATGLSANAAAQPAVGDAAFSDTAKTGALQDALAAMQLQDERQAGARGAAQALVARAEHGLQQHMQAGGQGGVALHGMTVVQPQELEQLRAWFKPARAGSSESDLAAAKASAVEGMQAGHGVAMGAAHAGAQGGGQDASAFAQAQADAQAAAPSEREQEISEQVAFWVHQQSQNAALTIEHEGAPIKVQVQLQGQEAHVRFAADDAQARDWLGSGEQQLRELLQAQGLQLAGVAISAGGGNAGEQAQAGGRPQDRSMVRMARVQVGADGLAAADAGPMQRPGSRASGVDLFV
ncbi:hypothetical protein GCM10010975_16500 [Comamonas phosphati]|nr:hypothetical protein GCM10010975_16500 [Comamonas phosphati]